MKIISKGIDPKTVSIMATCTNCRTTVEFMPSEAKYTSDQRDGDFYSVICPVCESTIAASVRKPVVANFYLDK